MLNYNLLSDKKPIIKLLFLITIFVGFMIFFSIFTIILSTIFWGLTTTRLTENLNFLRLSSIITQVGVFGFSALFFAKLITKNAFDYLKFNKTASIKTISLSILAMVMVAPLSSLLFELCLDINFLDYFKNLETYLRANDELNNQIMQKFLNFTTISDLILNLLILALLPAICEELFFRGALQNIFGQLIKNKHIVVFLTAIIFSAIHFEFFSFLSRIALGLILGYSVLYTGSLLPSIIIHFLNNTVSVVWAYLYNTNKISTNWNETGDLKNQIWIVIITTLISIFSIILLQKLYKKQKKNYVS